MQLDRGMRVKKAGGCKHLSGMEERKDGRRNQERVVACTITTCRRQYLARGMQNKGVELLPAQTSKSRPDWHAGWRIIKIGAYDAGNATGGGPGVSPGHELAVAFCRKRKTFGKSIQSDEPNLDPIHSD